MTIGTTWQYQVNSLVLEEAPVEAIKPAEGTTGWSDTWMIASEAAHPNCMYMWMDHMMSAEANGQATVYFGEAPTSQEACDYAETIAPGHCEQTHATDEAYWEDIWYWSTAREDCARRRCGHDLRGLRRVGRGMDHPPRWLSRRTTDEIEIDAPRGVRSPGSLSCER